MKKIIAGITVLCICMTAVCSCSKSNLSTETENTQFSDTKTKAYDLTGDYYSQAQQIVKGLTLEQKVMQMLQPATYIISPENLEDKCYGSGLMGGDSSMSEAQYRDFIDSYQKRALSSQASIPFMYGTDAVHGLNGCSDAVIFPHNIGIGAANDPELTYQMGKAVAEQLRASHIAFTFSPCLATAQDPRWGRTYESYSSDAGLAGKLGYEFSKGLIDGKVMPCAKHFLGDGNVKYGTGEGDMLIDRGNSELSQEEINSLLNEYQLQIDAGTLSIMVSHSSVNGVKMHENKELIQDTLKDKMGFRGFVISDWESIHNTSGSTLKEQVINAVNAGIDMLMEPQFFDECGKYILEAVDDGVITEDRINDAATRIIYAKLSTGFFSDPYFSDAQNGNENYESYRNIARQLVEKSLVLLKNDNNLLPLKKDIKIYITGLAADDTGVLCGGWTLSWQGITDKEKGKRLVENGKTILDGFTGLADEYGITVITDKDKADEADVVVLCVGEKPYAEWYGDSQDISITGEMALPENSDAIEQAKELGKPTVACVVSGRNVILSEYMNDWDAVVMCYLPGSEADGVADVLMGKSPFTGTLPMPFYNSVEDIEKGVYLYHSGYSCK